MSLAQYVAAMQIALKRYGLVERGFVFTALERRSGVQVDVDTGELTDVTTGWPGSAAVKFNSLGELFRHSEVTGEVVKIDLVTGDVSCWRSFPRAGYNLAFDRRTGFSYPASVMAMLLKF